MPQTTHIIELQLGPQQPKMRSEGGEKEIGRGKGHRKRRDNWQ